jgi:hypothetical protein
LTRAFALFATGALLCACTPGAVGISPIDLSARAPAASQRVVLRPAALVAVSSRGELPAGATQIVLGRERDGTTALLLRFEPTFREAEEVRGAFLLLEPAPDARRAASPLHLDVSRILEPWAAETAAWATLPRLDAVAQRVLTPHAAVPLRIDVTELVREWPRQRSDEHGIALVASAQDPYGLPLSSGAGAQPGPRLELYLQ